FGFFWAGGGRRAGRAPPRRFPAIERSGGLAESAGSMVLGVISDTHGYLDPQVFEIFDGVDHILHAGDLGTEGVAIELESLAPVTAVGGNVDGHLAAGRFPPVKLFQAEGWTLLLVHEAMAGGSAVPSIQAPLRDHRPHLVIFGHSHKPYFGQVDDWYFFNPGSAGRKRFRLPRTVGRLVVRTGGEISGRLFSLEGRPGDEMRFVVPKGEGT
ncbi:MAG: metallophosphoesterase family protein, partial [Nitrospinota bacterium]